MVTCTQLYANCPRQQSGGSQVRLPEVCSEWGMDSMHMLTDTEIKITGVRALVAALGDVQAEKFIALIQREPFDYTQWQRTLWPDTDIEALSQAAMKQRQVSRP